MGTLSCTLKRSRAVGGGDRVLRGVVLPVALRVGLPVVLSVGGLSFCRSARGVRAGDAIAGATADPDRPEMGDIYPRRGCEREVVRRWTLGRAGSLPARPRARRYVRRSAAPRRRPTTGAISDRARSAATSSNPRARDTSAGASQLDRAVTAKPSRSQRYLVPEIDVSDLRPVATAGGAGDHVRSSGEGMRDRKRDRKRGGKRDRKRDRKRGRPRTPVPEIDASESGSVTIAGGTGKHVWLADGGTRVRKRTRKRSQKRIRKRTRKRSRARMFPTAIRSRSGSG